MYQGKKWLDFSSCDFLGLSQHPEVRKAAIKYVLKYGTGVPVSPLGSYVQQQFEGKLAHYLGTEIALLFPCIEAVHQIVNNCKGIIISSDTEDLKPKKSSNPICLDESFTLGVTGHQGLGVAAQKSDFSLICGSLTNGIGCAGAFIAGSKKHLSQMPSSHPLSYAVLGALDTALNFVPEMTQERETVTKHLKWFEKQFEDLSFIKRKSPRLFLQFKSGVEAEKTRLLFAEEQIYLAPSVDHQLYIAFTALHTPDDLDQLATALKKFAATELALSMQSLTPTP
jgi:7-keto-8-aminopelargonate synthetase-like enzyme